MASELDKPGRRDGPVDGTGATIPSTDGGDASQPSQLGALIQDGGRYQRGDPLGEGGAAVVFEAEDSNLRRKVALKYLKSEADSSEMRERLVDEARILAAVDHPGVVPVYEVASSPEGELYYAMKKVQGVTFSQLLVDRSQDEVRRRENQARLVDIFLKVCETVAAAHSDRIIHRDLKPDNVMVDDFGAVYVMDWGLAKRLKPQGDVSESRRTRVGAVIGTPLYMSPEQAGGHSFESDCQSDVFSLGVILYEILTGKNPFIHPTSGDMDAAQVMKGVMLHTPPSPRRLNPRVDRSLAAVCMKALEKDPFRRYPSARELAEDVRRFIEFRPVSAIRPGIRYRLKNWARRRPGRAAVLATATVIGMIFAVALGIQLFFERQVLKNARGEVDRLVAAATEADSELARLRRQLEDPMLGSHGRTELEWRLEELRGRHRVSREFAEAISWGILGFSFLDGEELASQFLRDEHQAVIAAAIERGDYFYAREFLAYVYGRYERNNPMGLSESEAESLRELGRTIEAQIEKQRSPVPAP